MKKKLKWSAIPVVLVMTFFVLNNGSSHKSEDSTRKLTHFNERAQFIEGNKETKLKRSIASVKKPSVSRRVPQVMDKKMFKDKIKKRSKMAKPNGYRYRSISPNQGSDFSSGVSNYKFLDFFYAIKDTPENRAQYPNAEAKLNHLIVESDTPIGDSLPVVENDDTGNLGIFTGILAVKLEDMSDADFVVGHSQYVIFETHDHINLVLYRIDDVGLAIKTNQQLQLNPKVISSSLEILEYQRKAI